MAFVVLGDFAALTGFCVLMSIGIAFRRKPQVHKRAMLLAFIALVGPALGRIGRFPVFGDAGFVVVVAIQLLLLAALFAHDLATERRIHTIPAKPGVLFDSPFQNRTQVLGLRISSVRSSADSASVNGKRCRL